MITIECDFCGEILTVRDTRGISVSEGTFDIIEARCDTCNKATLDVEWAGAAKQDQLDADWAVQEAERRNFLESLLINQRAEFEESEKQKHYGTLYVPPEN